jgi:hypothetical protein
MFGGEREDFAYAKAVEVVREAFLLSSIDLVDGEEQGLARFSQQSHEFEVGSGKFGTAVDDHDDGGGFVKRDAGLAEDFRGDEVPVLGNDASRVDDAEVAPAPFTVSVEAVSGDAGFVADDSATGPDQAVEERGLADVRAANNGEEGLGLLIGKSLT